MSISFGLAKLFFSILSVNYLIIENLLRYDYYYGDSLKVECPTGSGHMMRLNEVAKELSHRLTDIFVPDLSGRRPCHGTYKDNIVYLLLTFPQLLKNLKLCLILTVLFHFLI